MAEWVALDRATGRIVSILQCTRKPDIFPSHIAVVPAEEVPMAMLARSLFWSA